MHDAKAGELSLESMGPQNRVHLLDDLFDRYSLLQVLILSWKLLLREPHHIHTPILPIFAALPMDDAEIRV